MTGTIKRLHYNLNESVYVGFVNNLENGTVKNLTIAGKVTSTSTSGDSVGGIVAYAKNSTIENCVNRAVVTGADIVGGIVGQAVNATKIKNCKNAAKIKGGIGRTGTIAGKAKAAILENCANLPGSQANDNPPDENNNDYIGDKS